MSKRSSNEVSIGQEVAWQLSRDHTLLAAVATASKRVSIDSAIVAISPSRIPFERAHSFQTASASATARIRSRPGPVLRQTVELTNEDRFDAPTTFVCCSMPSSQVSAGSSLACGL